MASLAVARYIQEATGISIKRVIRALKPLQDVTINLNGHHLTAADPLTPPKPKTSSPPSTSQQSTKTVQLKSDARPHEGGLKKSATPRSDGMPQVIAGLLVDRNGNGLPLQLRGR